LSSQDYLLTKEKYHSPIIKLGELQVKKERKVFDVARRIGHWDIYMGTFTCYSKEITKAKRSSWRKYCHITDALGSA
jgi:hypothetical protein